MVRRRWRGPVADTALVLGVCLVALLGLLVQSRGLDTAAEWTALPIVLASAAALCLRRRHPVAVGAVALAATAGYGALLHQPGPVMLVFVVALYTVVDEGHLAVAIGFGAASVVAFALADGYDGEDGGGNGATLLHAGWLVAVIVGVTRNRRAYVPKPWPGNAPPSSARRRRPGAAPPRSGCASPANSMTRSATTSR